MSRSPRVFDPVAAFLEDVRAGLLKRGQKELPCKYLYDEVGSALFEVISVLPEYGLTRADARILQRHADEITARIPAPTLVAELGSGSGKKTRWILESLARREAVTYRPIEISRAALARCHHELDRLGGVSIVGLEAEYLEGLSRVALERRPRQHLLVLFLGSSIGNFDRGPAEQFLQKIGAILRPGDALLLGTDLVKPVPQLVLAYDDPIGVTAAFNLNLLARINRELEGNFQVSRFRHTARYNERERRVELHLESLDRQVVRIRKGNFAVAFEKGETIWTESCHKYMIEDVAEMARHAGLRVEAQWIDHDWPFAQSLLRRD